MYLHRQGMRRHEDLKTKAVSRGIAYSYAISRIWFDQACFRDQHVVEHRLGVVGQPDDDDPAADHLSNEWNAVLV